jgi:hypothetical protein
MQLRIKIKQAIQYQANTGAQGYYSGTNPQSIVFTVGTLPLLRQWPGYGSFIDITNDAGDLNKLKLTWTTERDNAGTVMPGALQPKKSSSGSLTFEGDAYKYLKAWLIDDVSAALNSVDVSIEHVGCGIYENYAIKATDLRWCDGRLCTFDVTLKQRDEPLACIQRTLIWDDHQGWFHEGNTISKKHPRFSYCNEIRPNGKLVAQWFNMAVFATFLAGFILIFISIWNPFVGLIQGIISVVNKLTGSNLSSNLKPLSFDDLKDSWAIQFVESAGCGREHPAPLIRDYIQNVCSYCQIKVDETTADIFFASNITIQTSNSQRPDSSNGVVTVDNPHYNACYLFPQTKRGIRRFGNFGIGALFGNTEPNTSDYWVQDNAPILTLDLFLDQLKSVYNAEWMIKSINIGGQLVPHLYFKRKDFFYQGPGNYIYDLTTNGADRMKIVEGICYEWTGKTTPAYCTGLYEADPVDTCGNEARIQMNDIISFGNVDDTPTFGGVLDKTTQFGATKFRLDGASTDYIFDAMQVVVNSQLLTPIMFGMFRDAIYPKIEEYADYALLLRDETCALPKILIWDGASYENAKCRKYYYGHAAAGPEPQINYKFNATVWSTKHKPETFVIGSSLSLAKAKANPTGKYRVQSLNSTVAEQPARTVNYPMSFDTGFYDTLWDWFHWIDDPLLNPVLNQRWSVKLELCCDDLKVYDSSGNRRLGVFNDASQIALGEKVKLPTKYYPDGRITEITVSYDPTDTYGQYIELKGTV